MKRKTIDDFISDSKKVHGDKYDYSKVKYINNINLLYYSNLGIEYPYKVFENKENLIYEIKNGKK